jgi:hypothetical protein
MNEEIIDGFIMAGYLDFLKELRIMVYTKCDYLNFFEFHGCDVAKKEEYMIF